MNYYIEIGNTEGGVVAVDGVIHAESGPGRAEISEEVAEFCRQNSVAGKYCEVRGNDIVGFDLRSQPPGFGKDR